MNFPGPPGGPDVCGARASCGERPSGLYLKTSSQAPTATSQLQKGGVPATPSGTATLLRHSPSYRFCLRSILAVSNFRHSQIPWLDGRCVQGTETYSSRHGGCAITSESSFVESACRLQSELRQAFEIG